MQNNSKIKISNFKVVFFITIVLLYFAFLVVAIYFSGKTNVPLIEYFKNLLLKI